ncbi:CBASS cGAMP synthase [Oceanisphaera sp. IT1-181]|nr:CBASS cGAMP synthase [Oceanisphaera sp. IT1-181]
MKWSAHLYLTNTNDGLMKRLEPTRTDNSSLEKFKTMIRMRTKAVFTEAQEIVKTLSSSSRSSMSIQFVESEVRKTRLSYLDSEDVQRIVTLLFDMSDDARRAFLDTEPRFWVQGSYKYKTLNKPYHTPPQQMDIDDGTYMPMEMFKEQPLVGHELLLLLVDASLASLAGENSGWKALKKPTCGRIVIEEMNLHVDVPMYAIPKEKFLTREVAKSLTMDSVVGIESIFTESAKQELDDDSVYLAVRGNDKWMKSDPETVAHWFKLAVKRHKEPMRQICRYLKAWRDVQWKSPELSSIALMKCVVDIFDNTAMPDTEDHGEFLLTVTEQLATKLKEGIASPDTSDQGRLLFPKENMDKDTVQNIIATADNLHKDFDRALKRASTKSEVLKILNGLFGDSVVSEDLIKPWVSMPAYQKPRQLQREIQMNDSMTSA